MSTLIKIDRNGTKYFADDTCLRCGGAGARSKQLSSGAKFNGPDNTGPHPVG